MTLPPVLGITGYYLEPAAALLVDGQLRSAYREADLVDQPVVCGFPSRAVVQCLQDAGVDVGDVAYVGFADRPQARFRRVIANSAGAGFSAFRKAVLPWLKSWLHVGALLRRDLGSGKRPAVLFADFHEALLAAAFFSSPFPQAALLSLDGIGTQAGGAIGLGQRGQVRLLQTLPAPFSVTTLMQAVAHALRVPPRPGPWLELVHQGTPCHKDLFWQRVVEAREDGSFSWRASLVTGQGTLPRLDATLHQEFMSAKDHTRANLAASAWSVCCELTHRAALHTLASTGQRRLAVAGDWTVHWMDPKAVQAAGRLDALWVPPGAAGTAAAGVAWLVQHHVLAAPRTVQEPLAV